MAAADDYFESFCRQVLSKDYFIRSARIADHLGHPMAVAYRHGLIPLLTSEESSRVLRKQLSVQQRGTGSNQK